MTGTDGVWRVVRGTRDGLPVFARVRTEIGEDVCTATHADRFSITWHYDATNDERLPDRSQLAAMEAFEEAFMGPLEAGDLCRFYCVSTHDGTREWLAYCADVEGAVRTFNDAMAGHPRYPVQLAAQNDPDWRDYTALLAELTPRT